MSVNPFEINIICVPEEITYAILQERMKDPNNFSQARKFSCRGCPLMTLEVLTLIVEGLSHSMVRTLSFSYSVFACELNLSLFNSLKYLKKLDLGALRGNVCLTASPTTPPTICHIENINLSGTFISDISFVRNLPKLRVLDITDTNVSDISHLEPLQDLEDLSATGCLITDISALAGKQNLNTLSLGHGYYKSNLNPQNVLEPLNPTTKRISLLPLAGLKRLSNFSLVGYGIVDDIFVLQSVQPLDKKVKVAHCGIQDVEFLRGKESISELNLSHNSISSLEPLLGTKITELVVPNNLIKSIPVSDGRGDCREWRGWRASPLFSSLVTLNIMNNQLESLDFITWCPRLERIFAQTNKISSIPEGMQKCRSLRLVSLEENNIENIDRLLDPAGPPSLHSIVVSSNPIVFTDHSHSLLAKNDRILYLVLSRTKVSSLKFLLENRSITTMSVPFALDVSPILSNPTLTWCDFRHSRYERHNFAHEFVNDPLTEEMASRCDFQIALNQHNAFKRKLRLFDLLFGEIKNDI